MSEISASPFLRYAAFVSIFVCLISRCTASETPSRIISLVSEATEIICLLGAGDKLVGVAYQDAGLSGCADKPLVGSAGSPDRRAIRELTPDLVIIEKSVDETFFDRSGIETMVWETGGNFETAKEKLLTIGRLVQRHASALRVREQEQERADTIAAKLRKMGTGAFRGAFIRGRDDIVIDHALSVRSIFAMAGVHAPPPDQGVAPDDLDAWLRWNPEVIVGESREKQELLACLARPGWKDVEAVKQRRVYFFPSVLLNHASGHTAYTAAWLCSLMHTEAFADPDNFVHEEAMLSERPIQLDLPYVKDARLVESRIGDFRHRTALLNFTSPQQVLSTSDGWLTDVTTVGNSFAPTPMWSVNHLLGMRRSRDNVFRVLGLESGSASLLFTGADMNNLAVSVRESDELTAVVVATAGVESNAVRLSKDIGRYVEPGTINIILMTNRRLEPSAMALAVIAVTEAKTAALWDMDIRSAQTPRLHPATGTGTDGVIVVRGEGAPVQWVGGHAKLGQLIAEATNEAVKKAVRKQNGLAENRHIWARLAERRIYLERVLGSNSEEVQKAESLLMRPEWGSLFEAAFSLDDAVVMGQVRDVGFFTVLALDCVGRSSNAAASTLHMLPGDDDLPPMVTIALRALLTASRLEEAGL
ncbi:MAG: adenosylcobinamide amidohydrolase [Planctomycetaceae bacterium]|nr:adenosylcobinamide amidohydrolase [Planctomycetaceae bacterium]